MTQAMADGVPVTYGEVTLRAPTQSGGRGASGQHRLEWTDPDTGKRRQAGATKLADAWRRTAETAEMLQRRKQRTAHRSLTGVTLDQLVETYLQPGVHARWGGNRRRAVTWALTNWVVGDDRTRGWFPSPRRAQSCAPSAWGHYRPPVWESRQ